MMMMMMMKGRKLVRHTGEGGRIILKWTLNKR
jgi:hypothetical protein